MNTRWSDFITGFLIGVLVDRIMQVIVDLLFTQLMNNLLAEKTHSIQSLLSYRSSLLADLCCDLLAAKSIDVAAGRLLRDELRSIAADIRTLQPEIDADELLTHPPSDGYTLEQMMAILDRR